MLGSTLTTLNALDQISPRWRPNGPPYSTVACAGLARTRAQRPGCGVLAEYAVGAIGALFQGKPGGRGPCWQTRVRGLERPAEICLSARRVRAHGQTAWACDGARERHCRQDDGQGQRDSFRGHHVEILGQLPSPGAPPARVLLPKALPERSNHKRWPDTRAVLS